MGEIRLSDDKVMARIEELALRPTLTDEEKGQLETLLRVSKTTIERRQAETERESKEFDKKFKQYQLKREQQLKMMEIEQAKKDRWWNIGIKAVEIGAPLVVTVCLFCAGLSFETTNTFSSRTGQFLKSLMNLSK